MAIFAEISVSPLTVSLIYPLIVARFWEKESETVRKNNRGNRKNSLYTAQSF
jgi:hypothetical protein